MKFDWVDASRSLQLFLNQFTAQKDSRRWHCDRAWDHHERQHCLAVPSHMLCSCFLCSNFHLQQKSWKDEGKKKKKSTKMRTLAHQPSFVCSFSFAFFPPVVQHWNLADCSLRDEAPKGFSPASVILQSQPVPLLVWDAFIMVLKGSAAPQATPFTNTVFLSIHTSNSSLGRRNIC